MSYIGYPQPPRALTSADIDEGAVTLADISFTDTPSNLNLNGNYNDQTMRLAHNTTVTGDVTLNNSKDFTVSSSSGLLVSSASHNLSNDDQIYVQTSATLPTGLSINTNYYVISKTDDTFKLSTTRGGSAIAYTNAGSGTHTWYKNVNLILAKVADDGNPVTLTNDGSTRTLSGIGSIETSTLSSRPNSLVTGMTGELGSGVTGGSGLSITGMTGTIGSAVTGSPTLNLSNATFPAGHVIQTMWGEHATETSITSTTKGSGTAIGLTVTITPTSTSNKLLFNLGAAFYGTGGDGGIGVEIHDGSSVVATDANLTAFYINGDGTEYIRARHFFMAWVTPASTNSTTYSVRMFRDSAMTVTAQNGSEKSHITVQEIVQ